MACACVCEVFVIKLDDRAVEYIARCYYLLCLPSHHFIFCLGDRQRMDYNLTPAIQVVCNLSNHPMGVG